MSILDGLGEAAFRAVVTRTRAPSKAAVKRWKQVYGDAKSMPPDTYAIPAWVIGAAILAGGAAATWGLIQLGVIEKPEEAAGVPTDWASVLGRALLGPISLLLPPPK